MVTLFVTCLLALGRFPFLLLTKAAECMPMTSIQTHLTVYSRIARLNGVGRQLSSFCMDGRDFIQHITDNVVSCAKEVAAGRTDWAYAKYPMFTQVIMNLPGLAVDFLDVFPNLLRPLERLGVTQRPMIHCYCFSKAEDPLTDALHRAEKSLKTSMWMSGSR